MLDLREGRLLTEQVSLFVGHRTVITFQESPGDVWDPIRERLKTGGSRLRSTDASFLAYSLIDAVVDQAFPILEHFGDRLRVRGGHGAAAAHERVVPGDPPPQARAAAAAARDVADARGACSGSRASRTSASSR